MDSYEAVNIGDLEKDLVAAFVALDSKKRDKRKKTKLKNKNIKKNEKHENVLSKK